MEDKTGWILLLIGMVWLVAGNPEVGMTCVCTAIILFTLKGK